MGAFYFVRHGQTVWNVEKKVCGATDIALTEKGRQQAVELGYKIREEQIHIDEILYSPLIRAADTAKQISDLTGIPLREEIRLKEQNFGKWETTPNGTVEFKEAKTHFIDRYETGESMFQMAQRIYNLIDDIKKEPDKVYLLVAHNGISRFIESYFRDMKNEEFAGYGVPNCVLIRYEF